MNQKPFIAPGKSNQNYDGSTKKLLAQFKPHNARQSTEKRAF